MEEQIKQATALESRATKAKDEKRAPEHTGARSHRRRSRLVGLSGGGDPR